MMYIGKADKAAINYVIISSIWEGYVMRNHLPEISRGCRVMLLLIPVILLTGCGQAKTAKQLIRDAKYRHGACEVISQSDTSKGSKALLRDKLQGF